MTSSPALLPDAMNLLVLGQGTTGLDVVRWALAHTPGRVASVTVYGGAAASQNDATREFERRGVRFVYGTEAVDGSYDVCVASPGISEHSAFFISAREHAASIMGEPEFAFRLSPDHWCAITGTNGKTTTTALTNHIFNESGIAAHAVGNIGDTPISRLDARVAGSWFVAELSSYQLATTSAFHPHIGVLLNITPDHLSWHGSFEAYAEAKCKLFQNMGADDLAIIDVEDEGISSVRDRIEQGGVRLLSLGMTDAGTSDAAFVRDDVLVVRLGGVEHELARTGELALAGAHNMLNALAAASASLFAGADPERVRRALIDFQPLEHRIEPVAEVEGVRYYNDSKATNTDAVEKALTAFPHDRVVLLLGGHDKGTPLASFARVVMGKVGAVVCFGEARARFLAAMEEARDGAEVDIAEAGNLRDAVDVARSLASRGDVILLSPACSSFDEFSGFEERGRAFKAYVAELAARADA